MPRRPPWDDPSLDPRFRMLSKQTYPEKIQLLTEHCAMPRHQRTPFERMKLEDRLVQKYGNESEKFGMKFALIPSWAGLDGKCKDGGVEMDY